MNTRKKRPFQKRRPENHPVILWSLPVSRKNPSSTSALTPGVLPFSGPRREQEEATVTEWVIPARPGLAPAKITIISSGFGISAGRTPHSRYMAA